jgi:tubulin-folding cofactor B
LDEPVGKNDGTVKGNRVFECSPGFGAIVRGRNVTTGDFPERDLMEEGEGEEGCGCGEEEQCEDEEEI